MVVFLTRRVIAGAVMVLVVATAAFLLMSLTGGSAARNILGVTATTAQVRAKAHELGLDQPVFERYLSWLAALFHGDLGSSWLSNQSVSSMLVAKLPVTLSLVLAAIVVSALLSIALGMTAAVRGGWVDRFVQVFAVVGFALPEFWVALVLVTVFAVTLHLVPATGYTPLATSVPLWAAGLLLPTIALVLGTVSSTSQQVRGATIDVLRRDFVRTLRSRGISRGSLLLRHVLRNAAPPALTILSLQFVGLLSGAIVIEKVFALPGIGSMAVLATTQGDLPSVLGVVVVTVIIVVIVNLAIDLVSGWLNPKARIV